MEEVNRRMPQPGPPKLFLLSPASATGRRARQLASPGAGFATAKRFRSPGGVPVDEAFSFMSALYFRGKIAYARRFACSREEVAGEPILIIAPGFGFVPPHWPVTVERLRKLARTTVDLRCRAYARPMREQAEVLADRLPADFRVVLLGSIATGKYLDLLLPAFGTRLCYPGVFAGAGDMRRGSLMLAAARAGVELDYLPLIGRVGRRAAGGGA
jgi:hypothetical protein